MKQTLLLMSAAVAMSAQAEVMVTQQQQVMPSQLVNSRIMKAPQRGTVVKTLRSGAKGQLQLVRMPDGRLAKQIVRMDNGTMPMAVNRPVTSTAAVGSVNEDFGGWDGEAQNWIPEGWNEINTIEEYPQSYTWHVENNDVGFLANPTKGYECSIYMAMDQETYTGIDQDEWLITPAVTITEGQLLQVSLCYSPIFMFNLDNVDWDTFEFTDVECAASVKTMIREVGTEEWTLIQDYFDLWSDWSLNDLFDGGMDNGWRTYSYSLDEYAGKEVEVAFRYNGNNGDNWSIDWVTIDEARPEAAYMRPQGAFYFGFNEKYQQLKGDKKPILIAPGDVDLTWSNVSNSDATIFEWTYYDPITDEICTTSDYDLTLNYPMVAGEMNWYNIPELAAYAREGATPSTFAMNCYCIQAGGTTQYTFSDGSVGVYGAGNYDSDLGLTSITFSENTPVWGVSEGTDAAWSALLGKNVELLEVGNYFEKPVVPYTLRGIQVFGTAVCEDNAEVTVNVYKVVGGYLSDIIATATCKGSDVVTYTSEMHCLPFSFDEITVDEALLVMLDVKSATGFSTLRPFHTYYPAPQDETNGYFMLQVNGTEELHGVNYIQNNDGPMYCTFYFNLLMNYPTAEEEPVSISAIEQNAAATIVRYNVAGQRVASQQSGIVVERLADGRVRMVVK